MANANSKGKTRMINKLKAQNEKKGRQINGEEGKDRRTKKGEDKKWELCKT